VKVLIALTRKFLSPTTMLPRWPKRFSLVRGVVDIGVLSVSKRLDMTLGPLMMRLLDFSVGSHGGDSWSKAF
jgi:hypothetical protein